MLARVGGPSAARKKYEEVLLLPRKQLQHMDLSPPKAKSTKLTVSSDGQGPTPKRKELSDDENNAIWRRWKDKKDAERRRRGQANNAPLSDQELTPLVEQSVEESKAEFLKWKKKKDDERRREKLRKQELEAAWEREKDIHRQALREKLPPTMPSHQPPPPPRVDPMRLQQVQQKVLASPYAKPSRRRPHGCCALPQLAKTSKVTRPLTSNVRVERRPPTEASTVFIEAPAVDIEPTVEAQLFPLVQPPPLTASGKEKRRPDSVQTKLPRLFSALTMVEMAVADEGGNVVEARDSMEEPPEVQGEEGKVDGHDDDYSDDCGDEFGERDVLEDGGAPRIPATQERDVASRGTTSGYGSETWDV